MNASVTTPPVFSGLLAFLQQSGPLALAYSGGLDSRFLAHACGLAGTDLRLYHIAGPHVPLRETENALAWARARGLDVALLRLDPLEAPEVARGDRLRCYYCKRRLFSALRDALADDSGRTLCDGSNLSDREEYRPGMRALEELGVVSPLALCGVSKEAIRRCGPQIGFDNPGQQARPCLLTRFAYELGPTRWALSALERAEQAVGDILAAPDSAQEATAAWRAGDFRLRLVAAPYDRSPPELQLERSVPPQVAETLCRAVIEAGFPRPAVTVCASLHGFFDRKRPPDSP